MRASDCEIFFSSLRSRSRVRSSSAWSSSIVARSAGSGTFDVSSRRCSVVSPAFDSRSSFKICSRARKNSSCLSFMYSLSGIASSSASVRSLPDLVFQALASFGSDLWAVFWMSTARLFIWRVGGRGGANRSAKRDVGGGSGAAAGAAACARELARGDGALATAGGGGALAGAAGAGCFTAAGCSVGWWALAAWAGAAAGVCLAGAECLMGGVGLEGVLVAGLAGLAWEGVFAAIGFGAAFGADLPADAGLAGAFATGFFGVACLATVLVT